MEQIYVLEVIVYEIILDKSYKLNNVDNLSLGFKFAQRVNFDIDTQFFSSPNVEETPESYKIRMNFGKTFLFVSKPSVLRQLLQSDPYSITLYDGNTTIGLKQIPWKKEFSEMVKYFETLGIVKSTTCEDWHDLKTKEGLPIAKLNLFMRMSCYGSNVQTMFQIKKVGDKHNYVFKQRNESKTFQVEKHEDDRVQPIVAPLYTGITDGKSKSQSQINFKENVSLTELFAGAMDDKMSIYHGVEDTVSICYRPSANKFFNLLSLLTADVKAHDKGTCVTLKSTAPRSEREDRNDDMSMYDPHELTADKIQRKLCGNADCPAAKKFKEYGIGPLATGKNLGTLYSNDIEPPVTYGLSHTYGTMCEYGPYGVFSRPKQEELPFVPLDDGQPSVLKKPCRPKPLKKKKSKNGIGHSCGCPLRLRGGSDTAGIEPKDNGENNNGMDNGGLAAPRSPMVECQSVMDQFDSILAEYKKAIGPCGQGSCPYAQTLAEDSCRKACDQGAPGISFPVKAAGKEGSAMSCDKDPCEMEGCPYSSGAGTGTVKSPGTSSEQKKTRYPAGCGSPRCAYTKYKLGLMDDDAQLELQYLPPALGASCGDPNCGHPFGPPLPPIHWDCPDPLPQGACKNLNCPFLPAPLKKFKTKSLKTGPCGSPTCPYAIPPPCAAPTCPFAMVPCPMNSGANGKKERKPKDKKRHSKDMSGKGENLCEFPGCPFSNKSQGDSADNDEDYTRSEGDNNCEKPDCPSNNNGNKKRNRREGNRCSTGCSETDEENSCENPECPFSKKNEGKCVENDVQNLTGEFEDCVSPNCPYNKKEKKRSKRNRDRHTCDNPDCPSNKSKKKHKKKRDKREKKNYDDVSMCSNPECNYVKNKEKPGRESSSTGSICSDPDCPYAELKGMKIKKHGNGAEGEDFTCENKDDDSICSNPECPERQARIKKDPNICDQPGCPYSQQPKPIVCNDPRCPYAQPLPSCGIPNCPYEPIPLRFSCKNPQCPSKSINFSRSSRRLTEENTKRDRSTEKASVPVNMELNFTTVCEENVNCDKEDSCENPDCEMKEGESGKDNKALVPSGGKKKKQEVPKRNKKGKFVYSMGDNYPGTKMGHRECVVPMFNVPPHMGWLWNIFTPIMSLKPRRGWRPGALTKLIAQRIRAHRQAKGLGIMHVPNFKKDGTQFDDGADPKVVPKPTLQIQKKEGSYWVTMHPLKDPNTLVENEDPYMDCTPMTFKITKNKKPEEDYCACDGEASMEESSSSDSELDIEFTPPAGIIHPERFKKRPNVVCCQSQYDPQDCAEEKKEKKDKKGKGKDKKGGGKKGKKDKKKKGKK
ncbi:uncharacterized protein LOC115887951 isoform X1 [Sitophilus oryzae]|uniref:Uncharacterized protein LOC115887951 isoform X1 n=1 Tax=Sitophilus oryzae TaxID=7048 RepID=A0A6J2YJB8_SITOR|nr:uncharacterized protein LOC115887951 isoform X1 [Sitophilus oryzae]